jgi:thermitase
MFATTAQAKDPLSFIVKFKSTQPLSKSIHKMSKTSPYLKWASIHEQGKLASFEIPSSKMKTDALIKLEIKKLSQNPDIDYIVPNFKFHTFESPNDTGYPRQWALRTIEAEKAWSFNKGNQYINVAVIDTGVDIAHEDLKNNIWKNPKEIPGNHIDDDNNGYIDDEHGWDFFGNDNHPNDETSTQGNPGHGTHCAGIVAASGNNGIGISGAAWNTSIMPIRFLGADGSGDLMNAVKAIDFAINHKVQIISASWGAAVPRSQALPILEAIQRAEAAGILFVVAAANDGQSNDVREVYPANAGFSNIICVAASGPEDEKPDWSNFGIHTVDLASPGLNIYSTMPSQQYGNLSGTSMATPLVAGVASLLLTQAKMEERALTPQQAKAILQASANKVAIETACHCRVNAFEMLSSFHNNTLAVVPNALTLAPKTTYQFDGFGGKGPYSFESSQAEIASVDTNGLLTASQEGSITVTIRDSVGNVANSYPIYVKTLEPQNTSTCPFKEVMFCEIMCQIDKNLPWCQ